MSETNHNGENTLNKVSKSKKVAVAVSTVSVVVIAVLVLVIVYLLRKPDPVVAKATGGKGTVVTPENVDEIKNRQVEDGYYEVNMNNDWVFQTSTTPSDNAYVNNKDTNTRTVYFDVILSGTNEVVYSSPYIPVGKFITEFALDAELDAGVYPATVRYHLVDDDNNELTTVSVKVQLNILA